MEHFILENLTPLFKEWLIEKNTKKAKRVLKFLDKDKVVIWKHRGIITIEKTWSGFYIPNYVYEEYIRFKKHIEKI